MIFRELSNAAFRFSLRRPGAEIMGGGGRSNAPPPPAGGWKSRGPAGRGLTCGLGGNPHTHSHAGCHVHPVPPGVALSQGANTPREQRGNKKERKREHRVNKARPSEPWRNPPPRREPPSPAVNPITYQYFRKDHRRQFFFSRQN